MVSPGMSEPPSPDTLGRGEAWLRVAGVLTLLFLVLVWIHTMGKGFEGLGAEILSSFFEATHNPIVGLFIGILTTTLMQSSSVTTSMIVALVAAPENPLPIANAIPMIMGANVGTTVTSTIVALGHMGRPEDLRRAFAAASCHDFFNISAVILLLPLELATGFMARASAFIAGVFEGDGVGSALPNPVKGLTKAVADPLQDVVMGPFGDARTGSAVLIVVAAAIIFSTLALIVRLLRKLTASRMSLYITRSLDSTPLLGMLVGLVVTVMVQSSSITTSILVPLAGAGLVTPRQIFPVTLGANVGTTVTALVASMATAAETATLGRQIALVHLLFNVVGILIVYPIPMVRNIPVRVAERYAEFAARNRKLAVILVIGAFYGLPAVLIALSRIG
jgi:solute carrier family 34 (sodium-dependent phosphate cotransporter)